MINKKDGYEKEADENASYQQPMRDVEQTTKAETPTQDYAAIEAGTKAHHDNRYGTWEKHAMPKDRQSEKE